MRLAAPEQVITAQGVGSSTGSLASAGAALDLTFPIVESVLETSLVLRGHTDFYSRNVVSGNTLRLSNMFVAAEEDYPLDVRVSEDGSALTAFDSGVVLDPTLYTVDRLAGTLTLLDASSIPYGTATLSVSYVSGFAPVEDTLTSGFDDLPDWLVQAGVFAAMQFMSTYPSAVPSVSKDKFAMTQHMYFASKQSVLITLAPYMRPRAIVEWPVWSGINDYA